MHHPSIRPTTAANFNRTHSLSLRHHCNGRCKRPLMHEIDALPLNFNYTTVYSHILIACTGTKLWTKTKLTRLNNANTETTAINNDRMEI